MKLQSVLRGCCLLGAVLITSGCATGVLSQKTQLGGAKDTVGTHTQTQLVKCVRPLGTAALVEKDSPELSQAGLPSLFPLLRFMMIRSNCFQVVERGQQESGLMRRERAMMAEGDLKKGSSISAGQMVAADYLLTPHVVFQNTNASDDGSGIGAILGNLLSGAASLVAKGIKTENLEAQTVLTLTNVRTGLQESVAEGSARKQDIGFAPGGVGGFGGGDTGAVGGAYTNTDIGKIVSVAFLDSYNKLINSIQEAP